MAIYHLYYLKDGMLIGADDIDAAGDAEAARRAEDQGRGDIVEIWNASSRIRIVRPGGPLRAASPERAAAGVG